MSNAKEIRSKIASVKNTQKITRAMEMVAASKMRKAQDRMTRSKPYAHKIREVISHVANSHPEYQHAYLNERPLKRVGIIVVSTDRGLCGGLNINLFKQAISRMKVWADESLAIDVCVIGHKGVTYFRYIQANIVAQADYLGDAPKVSDLIGVVKVMLDAYDEQRLDGLFIARNEFINTMKQMPVVEQLLPIVHAEQGVTQKGHWDYIYEPDDAKALLTVLLTRYIESQVYQAVIENLACEQAARMVAMKSATDNAGNLINELKRVYNKARQSAITQEVCEIVTGADAIQ